MKDKSKYTITIYTLFFIIMSIILYTLYIVTTNIAISLISVLDFLAIYSVFVFIIVILSYIYAVLYKTIDRKSVRTKLHIIGNQISERIRMKNSNTIYPHLHSFLYETLVRNNDTLNLPLRKDYSAITPRGYRTIFRYGCVFYIFQIVIPQKPDIDDKVLRQLIQSFVNTELINYGIVGLGSYFNSRVYGTIPSVYIDRLEYIEQTKTLNFAVLYICTEEDARYVVNAEKRYNSVPTPEKEVFDDEII